MTGIRQKLTNVLLPLILFNVLVAAFGAFFFSYRSHLSDVEDSLRSYIAERGQREDSTFRELDAAHRQAVQIFNTLFSTLSDDDIESVFDEITDALPDGTYRSTDALYEGAVDARMGDVEGFAILMPATAAHTMERKRTMVVAYLTMARLAPAYKDDFESLWLATRTDDLIIFAPTREGDLEIYRKDAPADFGFQNAEFMTLANQRVSDVETATHCAPPSPYLYSMNGDALVTGCHTLQFIDDRFLALWGTTMPMRASFERALNDRPNDASTLWIGTSDGSIIAHEELTLNPDVTREDYDQLQVSVGSASVIGRIADQGDKTGIVGQPELFSLSPVTAFYHMETPDWYLIIKHDRMAIIGPAIGSALPVFLTTLLLGLSLLGVLYGSVYKICISPLMQMSRAFSGKGSSDIDLSTIQSREDEIGLLASTVDDYRLRTVRALNDVSQQALKLKQALLAEKQLNEIQNQVVSTVSHEFRTPLAIIDGAARRIAKRQDSMTSDEVADRVSKIRDAVTRMTTLMERTIDAAKLAAGKIDVKPETIDPHEIVEAVVERHKQITPDFSFNVDLEGYPASLRGDPKLLDNVFSNIVSNAVKYSKERPNIVITGQTKEDFSVLIVRDHGVGIPKDELPKIAERFFRASTSAGFNGTGIGLNLCKTLVEEHGGKIKVDSVEGEWTEFSIWLPLNYDFPNSQADELDTSLVA